MPALGGAGVGVSSEPSSPRMPDFRNAFTKPRTRLSPTRPRTRAEQPGVRDLVEARLDVALDHPLIGAAGQIVDLGDGVLGSAPGAEAIATRLEVRLEDRLEHRLRAAWTTRSRTVAMPSRRRLPPGFGIITSRTGSRLEPPSLEVVS